MGDTYLYDPVDGSSATNVLRRYCDVLRIDSLASARRYVIDARTEGSRGAYDSLRASVLGLPAPVSDYVSDTDSPSPWFRSRAAVQPVERRGPREWLSLGRPARVVAKGGAGDDEDDLVSKLQLFADACHDFGRVDPGPGRDMLEVLERSVFGAEVEYLEPRLTREDIADKDTFIKAVTGCAGFKFRIGGVVRVVDSNPMQDRNLEARITPFGKGAPGKRVVGRLVNDELLTVDVFFGKACRDHKIVVMKNIDILRASLADFFGDPFAVDRGRPKFMVDQDMSPFCRTGDPHRHLFAWMTGFGHLLVAMDEHFKGMTPLTDIGFDFVYCDATVYDGACVANLHDTVAFSSEPTGAAFGDSAIVDVEFSGLAREPGDDHAFAYRIRSTDAVRNPIAPRFKAGELRRECRDGAYEDAAGNPVRVDTSVATLSRLLQSLIKAGFDVASPIAQKTAGDWGQIEHCRRNGVAFVTCDRLAALRAASREVPVLLVKHHDYATDAYAQYSFCMFGTPESRNRLTARMEGGGPSVGAHAVLAAVVAAVVAAVACAIATTLFQAWTAP